jgi:hypothetical protein
LINPLPYQQLEEKRDFTNFFATVAARGKRDFDNSFATVVARGKEILTTLSPQ